MVQEQIENRLTKIPIPYKQLILFIKRETLLKNRLLCLIIYFLRLFWR